MTSIDKSCRKADSCYNQVPNRSVLHFVSFSPFEQSWSWKTSMHTHTHTPLPFRFKGSTQIWRVTHIEGSKVGLDVRFLFVCLDFFCRVCVAGYGLRGFFFFLEIFLSLLLLFVSLLLCLLLLLLLLLLILLLLFLLFLFYFFSRGFSFSFSFLFFFFFS